MNSEKANLAAEDIKKVNLVYENLKYVRPTTKADLKNYIKVYLGLNIPDKAMCAGHSSPMDYLWYAFNCDYQKERQNGDLVVWANRGGGKTEMAAVATLLDCIFKDGVEVRILAGSLDQAGRMYEYLTKFVNMSYADAVEGRISKTGFRLKNGSNVEVLTQSSKSVRGRHIHKLRCDEIEMFDADVFEAAQYVTKSSDEITASLEIASTMHRPYGLMNEVVDKANANQVPIFKWCLWEVIEKCQGRDCQNCSLSVDCGGRAKQANGYLKIDDAITHMQRSSRGSWESEVLCRKPMRDNLVFAEFDENVNVTKVAYESGLGLYRSIDFGYVNPFVCLWIQIDGEGVVRVIDEYYKSRATVSENAAAIMARTPCGENMVAGTFCDPAGTQSSDITGGSAVKELRKAGVNVRYKRSGILEGIEQIRGSLKNAYGRAGLIIDPKCTKLIEAMECYHYPEADSKAAGGELPVKDGLYDHPIDALRYFFANHASEKAKAVKWRY